MSTIEDSLREAFFPTLFGGEEIRSDLREILGNSVKCGGLGTPQPRLSAERMYNTSKASSEVLVGSLLGGTNLNYIAHKTCVRRASTDGRRHQELAEKLVLLRNKDLADGVGLRSGCGPR